MDRYIVTHLKAPNDANGNPRRGYLVMEHETGNPVQFIDEGYAGNEAVFMRYPKNQTVWTPPIHVSAKEYRTWIQWTNVKNYQEAEAEGC